MYAMLLLAWVRFIWDIPSSPSDLPGDRWLPMLLLLAQIVRPTMIGWFLVAVPIAGYGLLLMLGLARGDNWWLLQGFAWWLLIVAVLYTDLRSGYSNSAKRNPSGLS